MMNGLERAHRRADCVLVGAIALVAVCGVSAREFTQYTAELRARAALPDAVIVSDSPVALAKAEHALQSECLAQVIYYEARGEGLQGEKAVAEVVIQRAQDPNYPSTICGVIYDGVQPDRRDCQFSFACDGALRKPKEKQAWARARLLADRILAGAIRLSGQTGNAIAYHSLDVSPSWAEFMLRTAQIGNHVFYKRDPWAQQRLAQDNVEHQNDEGFVAANLITPQDQPALEEIESEIQVSGAVGDGA